jgi:hypothetical protein
MSVRWIGLSRPSKKHVRACAVASTLNHCTHAVSASTVLVLVAAMNFTLCPDALAGVVGGERQVVGFVAEEPSGRIISTDQPIVLNEEEVRLLAATVWGEARSEGENGMRAVAHVMVNRVGQRFGEDLATVLLSPRQFSVWNRSDPNRRMVQNLARDPLRYVASVQEWETAERIAREVLGGQSVDPTGGALFYHTRAIRPRWARYGRGRQVIGQHVFYADVPDGGLRATPRVINVAQFLGQALPSSRRRAREERVSGVLEQEAQPETGDVNAAATPTIDGVPISLMTPVSDSVS